MDAWGADDADDPRSWALDEEEQDHRRRLLTAFAIPTLLLLLGLGDLLLHGWTAWWGWAFVATAPVRLWLGISRARRSE